MTPSDPPIKYDMADLVLDQLKDRLKMTNDKNDFAAALADMPKAAFYEEAISNSPVIKWWGKYNLKIEDALTRYATAPPDDAAIALSGLDDLLAEISFKGYSLNLDCIDPIRAILTRAELNPAPVAVDVDGRSVDLEVLLSGYSEQRSKKYRLAPVCDSHAKLLRDFAEYLSASGHLRTKAEPPTTDIALLKQRAAEWMQRYTGGNALIDFISYAHAEGYLLTKSEHSTDALAVDKFANAMKKKMALAAANGRSGWDDEAKCSSDYLRQCLKEHIEKGDPRDVANFAMMLWHRGETTYKKDNYVCPMGIVNTELDRDPDNKWSDDKAERERELLEVIADLADTLDKLACLGNGPVRGNSVGNCMAIDAVEKHAAIIEQSRVKS